MLNKTKKSTLLLLFFASTLLAFIPEKPARADRWEVNPQKIARECNGYETNKFEKKTEIEQGGWTVAWADDVAEVDVLQGVVAAGIDVYGGGGVAFTTWAANLVDRTLSSLGDGLSSESKKFATETLKTTIQDAFEGESARETAKQIDTFDFKAGAIEYSGSNRAGCVTVSKTWGLKPYVAFRARSSEDGVNSSSSTESRIVKDTSGKSGCPNGAFARELVAKSNQRFGIRCYKISGGTSRADKSEFWTRKFIQLDGNGNVQSVQGASCPENRFVDEIVFDENSNSIAIRCRYLQAELNGNSYKASWSSDYWTRQFSGVDTNQINWSQCPGSSVISEVVKTNEGLYTRCRQVVVNGSPLNFGDDYWTRFFATRD